MVCVFAIGEACQSVKLAYGQGKPRLRASTPRGLLGARSYYGVIDQAEYATDGRFKDRAVLKDRYQNLLRHATGCFGAEEVLTFLGRKRNGNFHGEVMNRFKPRWPGARVKHRMKGNGMKLYDKHGCVLRIETVINHPSEFRIRREGKRQGVWGMGGYPMAKRVRNRYRYAEVCEPVTQNGRRHRALNPLRQQDVALFAAALRGEHCLHGFRNRDIAAHLDIVHSKDPCQRKRASARITRLLHLLHAHRLIAKVPRSRRHRVTSRGATLMSAAVYLHHHDFPNAITTIAA